MLSPFSYGRSARRRLTLEDRRLTSRMVAQLEEKRRDPAREAALFLDRCLRRLAGHENRCRRALGELLVGFRKRRAFVPLGFVRLGDYTRERLGCSGSEADTMARVAAGLARLPLVAEAFSSGCLSWTKARILVALADPQGEARWLEVAGRATVRELEAAAERKDGAAARERTALREEEGSEIEGEPRARLRIACPPWVQLLFRRLVETARRVSGENLPLWGAVEAIAAEGVSGAPRDPFSEEVRLEAMPIAFSRPRAHSWPVTPGWMGAAVEPDPLVAPSGLANQIGLSDDEVRELIPEEPPELPANGGDAALLPIELDQRMRASVRALQRIDWQTGRLLSLLLEHRLLRSLGFACLDDYLRERLGISIRKARALLALERSAAHCGSLAVAYREGRLSWVRAMVLLPVVGSGPNPRSGNDENDVEDSGPRIVAANAWVTRAREVTVRRLSDEVAWAVEQRILAGGIATPPPLGARLEPVEGEVQMREEAEGEQTGLKSAHVELIGPASVIALFRSAIVAWCEVDQPLWKGLVRLLNHVSNEWTRSGKHRDPVFSRDGWRCLVPACGSRKNLHDHHKDFRSRGGSNDLDNRVCTCAAHHLNGIHAGKIRLTGVAPDDLHWELGVGARPGGKPLLRLHGDVYVTA